MTTSVIARYLADNDGFIDDDSAAALSSLDDACWPALVEAVEMLTGGSDPGIDCKVAVTRETLAHFEHARVTHWREPGKRSERTVDGRPALFYERLQLFKGHTRKDMIVIDLGDRRVVLA